MQLGKTDGNHVSVGLGWTGFSFFIPRTRWTYAIWFGAAFCLNSRPGEFVPFVTFGRLGDSPKSVFTRMYHLRFPYNVIRIGTL
jgi:hypothetical protein